MSRYHDPTFSRFATGDIVVLKRTKQVGIVKQIHKEESGYNYTICVLAESAIYIDTAEETLKKY